MYIEITDASITPNNLTVGSAFVLEIKAQLVDHLKKVITYFHNSMPTSIGKTELKFNQTTIKTTSIPDGETYRFVCNNIKYTSADAQPGDFVVKNNI